jgi:hypothetical protein
MGNMWDGGRDLEGAEPVEYCESRFFEACDIGLGRVDRRVGGDVMSGGSAGWFAFDPGEGAAAGGDVAGDDVDAMVVVIVRQRSALRRLCTRQFQMALECWVRHQWMPQRQVLGNVDLFSGLL